MISGCHYFWKHPNQIIKIQSTTGSRHMLLRLGLDSFWNKTKTVALTTEHFNVILGYKCILSHPGTHKYLGKTRVFLFCENLSIQLPYMYPLCFSLQPCQPTLHAFVFRSSWNLGNGCRSPGGENVRGPVFNGDANDSWMAVTPFSAWHSFPGLEPWNHRIEREN